MTSATLTTMEKPWTVGVSPRGLVLFAMPWERIAKAWELERYLLEEARIYLVDNAMPAPPPLGERVDPEALGWMEVVRHPPLFQPI